MKENEYVYCIEINMPGSPTGFATVVRAISPEGAGDCVRVLLAQKDKHMTEIIVRVTVNMET